MFLNVMKVIPYETVKYMISIINYGGRVTDMQDNRLLNSILKDFVKPEIFNQDYRNVFEYPAQYDLNFIKNFIKELPTNDIPEYFGLHMNA